MIIDCSNCKKKFKIQEDRLPKDKIVAFPCKNCGDKFHLDLRTGQINSEKSTLLLQFNPGVSHNQLAHYKYLHCSATSDCPQLSFRVLHVRTFAARGFFHI